MTIAYRWTALAALLAVAACVPGFCQNGITQDEHDKQIKADTERNTKYHNNADDYLSNGSKPAVPTPPARIPARPKNEVAVDPVRAANDARVAAAQPGIAREFAEDAAKASRGDINGILDTARHYRTGYGVRTDRDEALRLYLLVADREVEGAYQAGLMLAEARNFGLGAPYDEPRARLLMKNAAGRGHAGASEWLKSHPEKVRHVAGLPAMATFADELMMVHGAGTRSTTVAESDKLIAELGKQKKDGSLDRGKLSRHRSELLEAGKANLYGVGIPVDVKRASKLLRLAAEGGEPDAEEYLGWTYYTVTADHPRDPAGMCAMLYKGEGQYNTRPFADYQRALCTSFTSDKAEQRQRLTYAAAGGMGYPNPKLIVLQACTDLAIMRLEGEGGDEDVKGGLYSLNFAAEKGEKHAQYLLGTVYEKGSYGVTKDPARAAQLYQSAAKAGQVEAQKKLVALGMVN